MLALVLVLFACGTDSASTQANPEPTPPPLVIPAQVAKQVALTAEGTRLDPAVDTNRIPEGGWMCDMGTVHFASSEPGTCPICGMTLVQQGALTGQVHE